MMYLHSESLWTTVTILNYDFSVARYPKVIGKTSERGYFAEKISSRYLPRLDN
jgi:hypothetical protein